MWRLLVSNKHYAGLAFSYSQSAARRYTNNDIFLFWQANTFMIAFIYHHYIIYRYAYAHQFDMPNINHTNLNFQGLIALDHFRLLYLFTTIHVEINFIVLNIQQWYQNKIYDCGMVWIWNRAATSLSSGSREPETPGATKKDKWCFPEPIRLKIRQGRLCIL